MSLDISLYATDKDNNEIELWETNITNNLVDMAKSSDLYDVMWRPHENGIDTAKSAIPHIAKGIKYLSNNIDVMRELNPENGWGSYENLLNIATDYYTKCKLYPSARIEVSR